MALDRAILEAAASWYVELRCAEADSATAAAHLHWLEADLRHRQAWERLNRLQSRFEQVDIGLARPTLLSARHKRREMLKVLSVLLAAGGTGAVCWRTLPLPDLLADARTAVGEHRTVLLHDGSRLQLNTATALDIRYSSVLREVRLLRGEILVETAHEAQARPFVVHTAQGSIRALGTRFLVRADEGQTRVCVLQHAVEVRSAKRLSPTRVDAGQQVRLRQGEVGAVCPADPQSAAWTQGMLVVDGWRLHEVIAELQRYRPGYLGCAEAVVELRISGTFHLADIDAVLGNLASTLPLRIRRFTPYWTRVEPA
ncbi:FecR domain-containing protein [Pseudomonas phoenicis]|uniref:FecR domain-containing protein n=1 Tax=unclassified Pseudomonas TaxID=196821 RepID=UPI0039A215A6